MSTGCECPAITSGQAYCPRYKKSMTASLQEKCREQPKYRELWDRQALQPVGQARSVATSQEKVTSGPGDVVKAVLAALGIVPTSSCGCAAFQQKMNAWGIWGCFKHRSEIVEWFRARAAEQGIEITPAGLWKVIREAWRNKAR